MNEQIVKLQEQFEAELAAVKDAAELENIRVAYLGKKGSITDLLKGMKDLSVEEKKDFGQKVNVLKNEAKKPYREELPFYTLPVTYTGSMINLYHTYEL